MKGGAFLSQEPESIEEKRRLEEIHHPHAEQAVAELDVSEQEKKRGIIMFQVIGDKKNQGLMEFQIP
jgi:hypothetical protein